MAQIMTVNGPIDASEMGMTLPHEHIIVDFGGAETAGPHRYNREEVVATMRPHVEAAMQEGFRTFVDCSPMYLARDVRVLRTLAEQTGMRFVTNTGQYKEPYLPARTFEITAQELADEWIAEWEGGIEGTDVRPGFIKTAVFPNPLEPIQRKVTTAAAITSRATGLTIGTHTAKGVPALEVIHLLEENGVDPRKWIFIHAHQEPDVELIRMAAAAGAWIELDGLGGEDDTSILVQLLKLLDAGYEKQIMLSHDAGWYHVGEPGGGEQKPFTPLARTFLPLARRYGVDDELARTLTVDNPARAFAFD